MRLLQTLQLIAAAYQIDQAAHDSGQQHLAVGQLQASQPMLQRELRKQPRLVE